MVRRPYSKIENKPESLTQKVFKTIEKGIIDGNIKQGERLSVSSLSKELGVSRTPVREALSLLEKVGLVELVPHQGAIVQGITKKDISDIFAIRRKVEGFVVKWAVERIEKDELEELQELVALMDFYVMRKNVEQFIELDKRFHRLIFKVCKSRLLENVLANYHYYILKAKTKSLSVPGRLEEALKEHKEILKAFLEKDPKKAEELIYKHITKGEKSFEKNREEEL